MLVGRKAKPKPPNTGPEPVFFTPLRGLFYWALEMKPKLELVPEWRLGHRLWSVRLPVLGGAILTFLEAFPDAFVSFWLAAPPDIRAAIDPETLRWIGIGLVFAGAVARFIKQRKLQAIADERRGAGDDNSVGRQGLPDVPQSDRMDR